jgi:hypothetical protein
MPTPPKNRRLRLLTGGTVAVAATVALLPAAPAAAAIGDLRITEVAPWSSGQSPVSADWFEITNTGSTAVSLTGVRVDDNSYSFASSLGLTGVTSLAAGESAIFIEGTGTNAAAFRTLWFGASPPATPQIGSYSGAGIGLGTGGDAVVLYDSAGAVITAVSFGPNAPATLFPTFDNAAGLGSTTATPGTPPVAISQLSAVGTNGAFASAGNGGNQIGSPGSATVSGGTTSTTTTTTAPPSATPAPWPGGATVNAVDPAGTYSSNMSGLDYEPSGSSTPGVLWAARNGGPSAMYRLVKSPSGQWVSDTNASWSNGKTLQYQNSTYPTGGGQPDTEGITMGGLTSADGMFVSTERDNANSGVSRNAILRFDVSAATAGATTLTATREWNITTDLPANGANAGLEGITWVPDSALVAGGFRDATTNAAYNPSSYPDHGNGVFFVGVEGSGNIHAYVLNLNGDNYGNGQPFTRIATFNSTLRNASNATVVMDVQYDIETGEFWAVCDDTCLGRSAVLRLSSTSGTFELVATFDRPAGMPNTNNEGFAMASLAECSNNLRPAFWADDNSLGGNAIREGSLPCNAATVTQFAMVWVALGGAALLTLIAASRRRVAAYNI